MKAEADTAMITPRPRYLYPALIVSLALNLLVVGFMAAAYWHHRHEPGPPRDRGFMGFVNQLPPDRREAIRKQLIVARETTKALRENVRSTWLAANALLTAEPFDKAKFAAALAEVRQAEDRFKVAIYGTVADTAADLTPDERKLLQEWRAKRHERMLGPPPGADKGD